LSVGRRAKRSRSRQRGKKFIGEGAGFAINVIDVSSERRKDMKYIKIALILVQAGFMFFGDGKGD
jgi:hypothetical protein